MLSEKTRLSVPGLLAQDAPRSLRLPDRDLHTFFYYVQKLNSGLKITPVMFAFFFSSAVQNLDDHYWSLNVALVIMDVYCKGLSSLKSCIFTLISALGKNL